MNVFTPQAPALGFKGQTSWLKGLAPDIAGSLITAAADIALVLDNDGTIRDVALASDDLRREGFEEWVGKRFCDVVTVESRPKVQDLLDSAGHSATVHFREINHPSASGPDAPVRYSAIRISSEGPVIALGRDLRHYASLQQRLVEAQQAMEREYARLRMAETRYRMLFNLASEPVVILEAANLKIVEANPAALRQLELDPSRLASLSILAGFGRDGGEALQGMLRAARLAGAAEGVDLTLASSGRRFTASASGFRQDGGSYLLLRFTPISGAVAADDGAARRLAAMVDKFPDGFVVIGQDLSILQANRAFLDMAQLASKQQAVGESLERWLGRPGIDLPLLMVTLTEHGVVRNFTTVIRGAFGGTEEVEVSAVPAITGDTPAFGFVLRSQGARSAIESQRSRALPRSVEHLADLVGRVSLKELVRETTDVIEKLCIEAALELSKDNRASAAQMLGLSRQSFYAKLRRYGLGELDDAEPSEIN